MTQNVTHSCFYESVCSLMTSYCSYYFIKLKGKDVSESTIDIKAERTAVCVLT